jgi:regulator of sigma E protease
MDFLIDHITSLIAFVMAVFIVLSVHEWGHYLAARLFGLHTAEFTLGYGKRLYSRTLGRTKYTLRVFPVGAHVSMNENEFDSLLPIKRAIIIIAGPLINLLFCFVLFFCFYAIAGKPSSPPVLGAVENGKPAQLAGLQTGDRILAVDRKEIKTYETLREMTYDLPVRPLTLDIDRDGKIFQVVLTPEEVSYIDTRGMEQRHGRLGVLARHSPYRLSVIAAIEGKEIAANDIEAARKEVINNFDKPVILSLRSTDGKNHEYQTIVLSAFNENLTSGDHKKDEVFTIGTIGKNFYSPHSASEGFSAAFNQTLEIITAVAKIPFQLFPVDKEHLSPQITVQHESTGFTNTLYGFLFLCAVLSVFIGLLNILPVPHFDGGRLAVLALDSFSPQPLSQGRKTAILFFALLLLYIVAGAFNYAKFSTYSKIKLCHLSQKIQNGDKGACHD